MAKTSYKFADYRKEGRPTDFVLDVDGERRVTIPPPDAETLLLIEEAGSSRRRLQLLCGEQFGAVWELIRHEDPSVMIGLGDDMASHFRIEAPPGGGRVSST